MSWSFYRPYVSAATRRTKALQHIKKLEKSGEAIEPLGELSHRMKIATSFWGRAWCHHLESFSDYENRLPRGRTYLRNGSVLHLKIEEGKISALVQGSEVYEINIRIDPLPAKKWQALQVGCRGRIGSLIELLQGRVSEEIMSVVTDRKNGLFPLPGEIHMDCNCPDWADLCKHLAAVLYGVAVRLDTSPELLFTLRGVTSAELVTLDKATQSLTGKNRKSRRKTLSSSALSGIFGEDFSEDSNTPDPAEPSGLENPSPPEEESKKPAKSKRPVRINPRKPLPAKKPRGQAATKQNKPFHATPTSIRRLRSKLGMSRSSFAAKLGVRVAQVVKWEQSMGALDLEARINRKLDRLAMTQPSKQA